jgi:hypothetical protein
MSTDTETDPRPRPRVLPWLIGIVTAVVVAVVAFAVLDSHENDAPPVGNGQQTVTQLTMAAPQGRCMAPDPTTLAQAGVAFSGSVVSVSNGLVTLKPSAWYAGDHTDLVTVTQVDPGMTNLVGAVDFRPGEDYFVAANDGAVMVCGFSGEKSSDLDTLYQQAFSGGTA